MNLFKVCCEPCEAEAMCCEQHSCCVECHCAFEELHALPYLPEELAGLIRLEHAELQRNGFPREAVLDHSRREMEIFRRYCPPQVLLQLDEDHEAYLAETLGLQPENPENPMITPSVSVGASPHYLNCPSTHYFNGYYCVPRPQALGQMAALLQRAPGQGPAPQSAAFLQRAPSQRHVPQPTAFLQRAPSQGHVPQPAASPARAVRANPAMHLNRGGRPGGGRPGGGRPGGGRPGGGRPGGGRPRYYGGWGGGWYPYYVTQETQPGYDCLEFDTEGNCTLLKKRGADVNLQQNPITLDDIELAPPSLQTKPQTPCPPGFTWFWHPAWKFWYCGTARAPSSSGSHGATHPDLEVAPRPLQTKPQTPCPPGFTWLWHPAWKFWYCGNARAPRASAQRRPRSVYTQFRGSPRSSTYGI